MTAPSPTVFVVDDYAPVRRSISRLLRAAGFAVAAFASAEEFLTQYDPQTCRVVSCSISPCRPSMVLNFNGPRQNRQSPAHYFSDR